ncbi:MAG: GUN4 domain-containing protein [Leptolyngbyaceae cyanobacterium bins.302]|nr:GUN4 domain-containing protein [Leptolyngbyaceae cyanobacterium bins.302]
MMRQRILPVIFIAIALLLSILALFTYSKWLSARSVTYQQLEASLAAGRWKEADRITAKLILVKASGGDLNGILSDGVGYSKFTEFPCKDLLAIDKLWLKYSKNRFGLSVQEAILQPKLQETDEIILAKQDKLREQVGWSGVPPYTLNFSLQAPKGHLPSDSWVFDAAPAHTIDGMDIYKFDALLLRTKECSLKKF